MLTEKLQIYICLLILFQVNEKQRRPGESRALFYFERDDQKQNSLLDDISEFLKPSVSLSELDILPLKATTTTEKKYFGNGTSSELKVCPMIPPNLHGAVKVVRSYLSDLALTVVSWPIRTKCRCINGEKEYFPKILEIRFLHQIFVY